MSEPLSTTRPADLEPCDPEDCDGEWHTCNACGGFGWNEVDHGQEQCEFCHGTGGWPCPRAGVAP